MNITNFISLRYLLSKKASNKKNGKQKKRPSFTTTISFLGITLSLATLISVSAVFAGFKNEFIKTIIGTNPHITAVHRSDTQINQSFFNQTSDIQAVYKLANAEGMIIANYNNSSAGVVIKGISQEEITGRDVLSKSIELDKDIETGVILGKSLASNLGLDIGDSVNLVSASGGNTSLFGFIPNHKTYRVKGIFKVGISSYDSNMVLLDLNEMQRFLGRDNYQEKLSIFIKNPNKTNEAIYNISRVNSGYYMYSWKDEFSSFINAINVQSSMMFFILTLFVIVGAFIIFSSMTSLVNDKIRDISVLRTMGIAKKQVLLIFLKTGIIITTLALICGTILGIVIAKNLDNIRLFIEATFNIQIFDPNFYFLSYIPSSIDLGRLVGSILITTFFCVLGVVIPAVKSSKKDPAYALKWV